MVYDEEKALERVNSEDNLINKLARIKAGTLEVRKLPRSEGPKQIPEKMQQLIGITAKLSSGAEASRVFDRAVTPEMANTYKRGETKATKDVVKDRINEIHGKAIDAMLASIDKVTELAPNIKKATEASIVASNMAKVIEKTSPQSEERTRVVVVAFAPNMKSESDFESIEVTASQS